MKLRHILLAAIGACTLFVIWQTFEPGTQYFAAFALIAVPLWLAWRRSRSFVIVAVAVVVVVALTGSLLWQAVNAPDDKVQTPYQMETKALEARTKALRQPEQLEAETKALEAGIKAIRQPEQLEAETKALEAGIKAALEAQRSRLAPP